ncbi:MAG: diacylglycerol kinase family protein [Bacilli bacterium]|nr:diacylglycerol kinase family protein [Bacilli bacterium]
MKQVLRNKDKGTKLERYKKSFLHAIDGLIYTTGNEHNMAIILPSMILAIIAGILFKISPTEWLFMILVIGLVIGSELINTAIEAVVDLETLEYNPLAKIAKDTASSATLVFSIVAFIGALIMFVPKIIVLL